MSHPGKGQTLEKEIEELSNRLDIILQSIKGMFKLVIQDKVIDALPLAEKTMIEALLESGPIKVCRMMGARGRALAFAFFRLCCFHFIERMSWW